MLSRRLPAGGILALLVASLLFAWLLPAQSPSATIVGSVIDASGGSVPGASIKIRNVETNQVREIVSGQNGEFTVPNLAAGRYEAIVIKTGFRELKETNFELQIDQLARMDFKLEVGSASDTVEVHADTTPLLNTESAVKGEVMVAAEIVEMPLNGRDFSDLAFLVPGVARRAQGGQGSNFNINGARADNTNFIIDGFNDQNPRGAAAQATPNLDALQEFKVQTANYSAEYGRLAGGVINMVLKSGTNRLHGVLFEFLRNDIFDARNFFDADKSKLRRNQFGGTVGGPIAIPKLYNGHDKTFFLFSWESYRQVLGETRLGRVPTTLERQADFSETGLLKDPLLSGACTANTKAGCFPGDRIPSARISPIAQKIAAFFPLPNLPGHANNYRTNVTDNDEWDSFIFKIDHRLSTKDNVSFRFLKKFSRSSNPFNGSDLGTFGSFVINHQSLMGLAYTRVFTPAVINESRIGFIRTADRETGAHAGRDYAAEFGVTGVTTEPKLIGIPRFTVRDLVAIGDGANMPVEFTVNNIQLGDTLTVVKSKHLFKFGGEYLRTQFLQPYYNNNRGTFDFLGRWTTQPFADFLLGLPETTSRQIGSTPNYLYSTNYSLFAQDDWKIASKLTLNLGLRYEIIKPPEEKYGRLTNFVPELGKQILADDRTLQGRGVIFPNPDRIGLARDFGLPPALTFTRYKNFAPRVGFAWRPFSGNRTVVRSGYGIFYGVSLQNPVRTDLADVFPFAIAQTFNRKTTDPNFLTLSTPFPTGVVTNVLNGYELHANTPYLQSWNMTIEQEIGWGSAIEVSYVGSKGTHLGRKYDINQPFRSANVPSASFPRPYPVANAAINYYGFNANSTYNAGMISIRKRFTRGFFYRLNYSYAKSIDDASQTTGNSDGGYALAQNSRDLHGERGRSDWDVGHTFTMNFSYEVPWRKNLLVRGWQVAGTGRAYTGQPFTPKVSNVNLNLGDANRPDRIAKGALDHPSPDRWYDIAAFPVVPTGSFRFGNSGRNIVDGPGSVNINLTLLKNIPIRENSSLQFRWEVFNAMNHPNLHLPVVNVNAPNAATIKEADPGRLMQFGLRYRF
ncbi:MAG: TonB-dependent receptor [Acidobacteriota bacterium]|nr:TonB-dependent receptor [Acidobacteriota bacterium]